MVPITIHEFARMTVKSPKNKGLNLADTEKALQAALDAKNAGATCTICGQPIWAVGSGITGSYLCFTCTTGEADDSEDYEVY